VFTFCKKNECTFFQPEDKLKWPPDRKVFGMYNKTV